MRSGRRRHGARTPSRPRISNPELMRHQSLHRRLRRCPRRRCQLHPSLGTHRCDTLSCRCSAYRSSRNSRSPSEGSHTCHCPRRTTSPAGTRSRPTDTRRHRSPYPDQRHKPASCQKDTALPAATYSRSRIRIPRSSCCTFDYDARKARSPRCLDLHTSARWPRIRPSDTSHCTSACRPCRHARRRGCSRLLRKRSSCSTLTIRHCCRFDYACPRCRIHSLRSRPRRTWG